MVHGAVPDLLPDANVCEAQENVHLLIQLICTETPNVPNQTPIPQMSKRLPKICPIPTCHAHHCSINPVISGREDLEE